MKNVFYWCTALALVFVNTTAAQGVEWKTFVARDYGFSMIVPSGARLQTKEFGGGWGGLRATYQGIIVNGRARLGAPARARDIEDYGVRITGLPSRYWKTVDRGKGKGWIWYRTVRAVKGGRLIFGGYGVGRRGSYLMLIDTTPGDFKKHRADYMRWYNSIRLN